MPSSVFVGFPIVPTALYSVFRALYDDDDCWVAPSREAWIDWIITGPCLAALCANFILMIAILYILIRKLRFSPDHEPAQYRKAVRATLILLPVFGLHFLLTIYRLPILAHEIFNLLLDGLQGFFVAIIICYTNGRVTECLHKTWQARKDQDDIRRQSIANRVKYRKSMDLGRTNETESMLMTMALDDRRPSDTSSHHLHVPSS
uniref:G-protein coupled receptors family 2 profile 2 domain-containing protein n=1 Tax=Plectus sambesii TaxID=2011161 RepID=A0A914WTE7_9BILA